MFLRQHLTFTHAHSNYFTGLILSRRSPRGHPLVLLLLMLFLKAEMLQYNSRAGTFASLVTAAVAIGGGGMATAEEEEEKAVCVQPRGCMAHWLWGSGTLCRRRRLWRWRAKWRCQIRRGVGKEKRWTGGAET